MKFKSDIEVQAGLKDSSGAAGTSGQVLSSDGTAVSWIDAEIGVARDVQNRVKAGVAINKGQAVYVTGADGTNIIVGLASNTSEATSSKTLGLLNATVATNGFADVVQIGKLTGLNTIGAVVGDPVWLGTNGNLIYGLANKPYAPAHLVYIGVVTRVNASNGEIFVTVQNGFELKEIHDVDIITTAPTNGDVLGYDGSLWVNKTIPGWLGYTPANDANVVHITGSETITGAKAFTGTISSTISSSTDAIFVDNTGGRGIRISNNSTGFGLIINNGVSSTATPFALQKGGTTVLSANDAGEITANKFIKLYGTASQILAADGSVITAGTGISISGGTISSTVVGGVTSFNTRTGAITLTSTDVTTALGYTPANNSDVVKLTGNQTIAGDKTFTSTIYSDNATFLKQYTGWSTQTDYTNLGGTPGGIFIATTSASAEISMNNLTAVRSYELPDASGTIALTSSLGSYVPYTGATGNVNLGSYSITANSFIKAGGNSTQYLKADGSVSTAMNSRIEVNFIATSGQTTFVTPYEVGQIDVYYNGSKLYPNEFTATNGTDIILATGATLNAQISIVKYVSSFTTTAIRNETTFTTTAGQTTFAVNYSPGQVDVFYNGSKLNISEFTATNGTSVVLGFACAAGESVVIDSYVNQISGASGNANKVAKFTGAASLGDSSISDNGTVVSLTNSDSRLYGGDNVGRFIIGNPTVNTYLAIYGSSHATLPNFSQIIVNNLQAISMFASGNVFIGSSPADAGYKLDVNGTGRFSGGVLQLEGGSYPAIQINGGSTGGGGVRFLSSGNNYAEIFGEYESANNGMLLFRTRGSGTVSERMRITPSGFAKFSNTGSYFNLANNQYLFSSDVANLDTVIFRNTSSSPYGIWTSFTSSPNNTTNYFIVGDDGTQSKFFIYSNGSMVNRTGSYGTISDIKYKENIIDASSKLEDILELKVRNFNFIGDDKKQIGFIAQEFEEVFPNMIDVSEDIKSDGETYKSIKTSVLTPILVKAMQELAEQVKELKAEIEILKNK